MRRLAAPFRRPCGRRGAPHCRRRPPGGSHRRRARAGSPRCRLRSRARLWAVRRAPRPRAAPASYGCPGPDGRGPFESASVRIGPSGKIIIATGAAAQGAMVVTEMAADREKPAVRARGRLDLPVLHALVVGGGEAFAAILDPFDRTLE